MTEHPPEFTAPEDIALLRLADDVCSAIEEDDFSRANTLAIALQTTVRERLEQSPADTPETANLLSILQYVSERQRQALRLSSRKKRDVVQSMRKHQKGVLGVSSYLNHVR
ncbi:MAG: hypothetical protein AAF460_05100 [Pseudomonadota bacterium]